MSRNSHTTTSSAPQLKLVPCHQKLLFFASCQSRETEKTGKIALILEGAAEPYAIY